MHEPCFKLFYEIPIYELTRVEKQARLNISSSTSNDIKLEDKGEFDEFIRKSMSERETFFSNCQDRRRPWPEVEFLFGEDENYQELVYNVMRLVTLSNNAVTSVVESYNKYCKMVYSIINLDIEKSIDKSQTSGNLLTSNFSPDDFQFILSKHTEQVEEKLFDQLANNVT